MEQTCWCSLFHPWIYISHRNENTQKAEGTGTTAPRVVERGEEGWSRDLLCYDQDLMLSDHRVLWVILARVLVTISLVIWKSIVIKKEKPKPSNSYAADYKESTWWGAQFVAVVWNMSLQLFEHFMFEKCLPITLSRFSLWQFSKVTWDGLWQIDDDTWVKLDHVMGTQRDLGDGSTVSVTPSVWDAIEPRSSLRGLRVRCLERQSVLPIDSVSISILECTASLWVRLLSVLLSEAKVWGRRRLEGPVRRNPAQRRNYSSRIGQVTGFCPGQKSFVTDELRLKVTLGESNVICPLHPRELYILWKTYLLRMCDVIYVTRKKVHLLLMNSYCLEGNTRISYPGIQNNCDPWKNFPTLFLFICGISTSSIKEKSNSIEVK